MKKTLVVAFIGATLAASNAIANGMCPFDEQGPLGCPEGTVWYAEFEVCLLPEEFVG